MIGRTCVWRSGGSIADFVLVSVKTHQLRARGVKTKITQITGTIHTRGNGLSGCRRVGRGVWSHARVPARAGGAPARVGTPGLSMEPAPEEIPGLCGAGAGAQRAMKFQRAMVGMMASSRSDRGGGN